MNQHTQPDGVQSADIRSQEFDAYDNVMASGGNTANRSAKQRNTIKDKDQTKKVEPVTKSQQIQDEIEQIDKENKLNRSKSR